MLRPLQDYLGERTNGPLFLNRDETARLAYTTSYALIPPARPPRQASPPPTGSARHSLRHSFATGDCARLGAAIGRIPCS